jgi:O-antigen/teichoic acid export membrane protein
MSMPARSPTAAAGNTLRTRTARGTLINTAFTVALGALGLLESFIMAKFVTRAQYGVWGVLGVTLATLLWLKQVGIGDKFVQQEEADQELAFQKAFTLELAFTVLLVVVLAAAVPVIAFVYQLPQVIAPGLVIGFTLLVSSLQAPLWIYYRRMDFARQRALDAVNPVIGFVVGVTLAALGAGYWAFVGGLATGTCAAAVAAVVRSPYPLRLRYERGTLRSYTSFSGPLLIASGASFLMTWTALIAAKLDLGIAALGSIALAATITSFSDQVDQLVTGTLYPAICAVRENLPLLYESFVKSNRLALMCAIPFGTAVALFSADLVRFGIGEQWRPAVIVLEVCGMAAAINHVGFNWTAYLRAIGRTRPIAIANVASTAGFLVVGIPLLLAFGLPGFAAGLAFQGLVGFVLRAFYLQRLFPGFVFLRHLARSFLPTIPAAALVLVLRTVEPGTRTLAMALVELVAYLLVTAFLTWRFESRLLWEAVTMVRGRTGSSTPPAWLPQADS